MLSISIIQIVQVSTYFRIRICTMRNFALRALAHVVTGVPTVPSAADKISVVTKYPALHWHSTQHWRFSRQDQDPVTG